MVTYRCTSSYEIETEIAGIQSRDTVEEAAEVTSEDELIERLKNDTIRPDVTCQVVHLESEEEERYSGL